MISVTRQERAALSALKPKLGEEEARAAVEELRGAYEERAAIGEYLGGLTRDAAERMALERVWHRAAAEWRAQ